MKLKQLSKLRDMAMLCWGLCFRGFVCASELSSCRGVFSSVAKFQTEPSKRCL